MIFYEYVKIATATVLKTEYIARISLFHEKIKISTVN
jgi:hypothetical protein